MNMCLYVCVNMLMFIKKATFTNIQSIKKLICTFISYEVKINIKNNKKKRKTFYLYIQIVYI